MSLFNFIKASAPGTVTGTPQNDIIVGSSGSDLIQGSAGTDLLFGRGGNDRINGGNGNDLLVGMRGNDTLTGGGGTDFLYGGRGADTFRVDADAGKKYILDFNYGQGDRVDIPSRFSFADAKIVDNGPKCLGVTVSFSHDGEVGPQMVIFGVDKVSDVHADWFI